MALLSEGTVRALASSPVGGAIGSGLGAAAGLLEPLDYPRQAAWWAGNRLADLMGDAEEADYTPESLAGGGVGSVLLSMLTDPLTYVGGGLGGLAGRTAGRQVDLADDLYGQVRRIGPGYEALRKVAPEVEAGAELAARQADDYAGRLAAARAAHQQELQKVLAQNTTTLGGKAYPVEDVATQLLDEQSALARAILGGQVPGVMTPRVGKKLSEFIAPLEEAGYAYPVAGGRTAIAYEGLKPLVRRRGPTLSVENVPTTGLPELPPGPFARVREPLELPEFAAPAAPPDLTLRDVLLSGPEATAPGSGRDVGAVLRALDDTGGTLDPTDILRMPVAEMAPIVRERIGQFEDQARAVAAEANALPPFGRWFARTYQGF